MRLYNAARFLNPGPTMLQPQSRSLLWLLAFLNAVGPLSTDLYLPAWPAIESALHTDIQHVQLTLSSYLIGYAFCQLICGPLSDRFGRRPVLLGGLVIFLAGSLACASAQTIEQLILFRIVQGIGACIGPTVSRAVIRDVYTGPAAAKAMGLSAAMMTVAPIVAPMLGGLLITHFDWPMQFYVLVIFVAISAVLVLAGLPETWPSERRLQSRTSLISLRDYASVLGDRHFRRCSFSGALLYAGAMAFLASASSVLIGNYGVKPGHFGAYFAVMVLGFTTGSMINARFGEHIGARAVPTGITMSFCAAWLALIVQQSAPRDGSILGPALFVSCMALYTGGIGLAIPQAVASAMRPFAQIAGTASSLWGFLQMATAAIAGAWMGWALRYGTLPLPLTMIASATLATLTWHGMRTQQSMESRSRS
jgi:MFS transporter, DHA1 family, multidrug resistance protein